MRYKSQDGFPDPTQYPTFWINHASRALMGRFEERLRPLGFGAAYLPVVWALENGPKSQKELLARIAIAQSSMAALLTRMERDGILTRETDPTDRRALLFTLTAKAQEALPQVQAVLEEVATDALAGISEDDQERLMALLKVVVRNLADREAPEMTS